LVILAHARGRGDPAHLQPEGAIGKMKVFTYAFDLAGNLEEEEQRFANTVKQLITSAGPGAEAAPALAPV
jgi:hypothetical protein